MIYDDKDRDLADENYQIFQDKHAEEWQWNWQLDLKRWAEQGAFIGEYHLYPQPLFIEPKIKIFKSYEEERQYALNKVLSYLEKEFIK